MIGLSSWAAERGSAIPKLTAYAASKAAIRNLIQTIARNHAREGVLAYVVAPGSCARRCRRSPPRYRGGIDAVNAALAMGAMVEPIEVARTIAFLATGDVPNLTRRDAGPQRCQPHPLSLDTLLPSCTMRTIVRYASSRGQHDFHPDRL